MRTAGRTALVLLFACIGGGVSELEAARGARIEAADPLPASTAWVTFLDTSVPGFVLGAVVLGHSIRKHSVDSSRQMVCLVAGPPLTAAAQYQLGAAGWELTNVPSIANPMAHHPAKLKRVFSKLAILGLPFSRVVYLDSDTLVVSQGAEKLFLCPATICASLRHSERWNSGVISLAPSDELLQSAVARLPSTRSYTGGDQGLLNEMFPLANSPLIGDDKFAATSRDMLPSARVSSVYNADMGLFVLSRRFAFSGEPAIVHFTLGPLKPWQWWAPLLLPGKYTELWMHTRAASGVGMLGWCGLPATQIAAATMMVAKAAAVIAWTIRCSHARLHGAKGADITARAASWLARHIAGAEQLVALSAAILMSAGGLSAALAIAATPRCATPLVGFSLFQLLTAAFFSLFGSSWLNIVHECGRLRSQTPVAVDLAAESAARDGIAVAAASLALESWLILHTGFLLLPSLPFLLLGGSPAGLLAIIAVLGAGAGVLCSFGSGAALAVSALWLSAGSGPSLVGLQGAADKVV